MLFISLQFRAVNLPISCRVRPPSLAVWQSHYQWCNPGDYGLINHADPWRTIIKTKARQRKQKQIQAKSYLLCDSLNPTTASPGRLMDIIDSDTVQNGTSNTCMHPWTHWGRVTHKCVSKLTITDSDNGFSPGRRQGIIWTNAGLLFIGSLATNVSEIIIEI